LLDRRIRWKGAPRQYVRGNLPSVSTLEAKIDCGAKLGSEDDKARLKSGMKRGLAVSFRNAGPIPRNTELSRRWQLKWLESFYEALGRFFGGSKFLGGSWACLGQFDRPEIRSLCWA
jgi:hypothetical protein